MNEAITTETKRELTGIIDVPKLEGSFVEGGYLLNIRGGERFIPIVGMSACFKEHFVSVEKNKFLGGTLLYQELHVPLKVNEVCRRVSRNNCNSMAMNICEVFFLISKQQHEAQGFLELNERRSTFLVIRDNTIRTIICQFKEGGWYFHSGSMSDQLRKKEKMFMRYPAET